MTEPELAIIIVNWNGKHFLPDCLSSIVQNPPALPYEVVVVDNDSSDGSAEWLRSEACAELMRGASFTLIEPGENLGFGPANNLAISRTRAAAVLVLNPDTRVLPGAITRLVETLRSQPTIGMVGPRLLNDDGTLQDSVSRHPQSPASIIVEGLQIDRLLPKRLVANWLLGIHWDHDERRPVPVIAGAAMMCRREMIDEIGAFDPSIHMYSEDIEWCVRAARRGWGVHFEPDAEIVHARGKSSSQRWSAEEKMVVQERAMIYYENKAYPRRVNVLNGITRVLVMSIHVLRWKLLRRDTSLLLRLIRLHLDNCKGLLLESGEATSKAGGELKQG